MWSKKLDTLLDKAIEYPELRLEIEKKILSTYSQKKAFLVSDMCGFSRITHKLGIFQFMLMIHQMRLLSIPCVKERQGLVIKAEADNLFCLFDGVSSAVYAAKEIVENLNGTNNILPSEKRLYVSIGIGFGDILNIENTDIFGDEINLACKLGEDIGEKSQVLITENAFNHFTSKSSLKKKFKKKHAVASNVKILYYELDL